MSAFGFAFWLADLLSYFGVLFGWGLLFRRWLGGCCFAMVSFVVSVLRLLCLTAVVYLVRFVCFVLV